MYENTTQRRMLLDFFYCFFVCVSVNVDVSGLLGVHASMTHIYNTHSRKQSTSEWKPHSRRSTSACAHRPTNARECERGLPGVQCIDSAIQSTLDLAGRSPFLVRVGSVYLMLRPGALFLLLGFARRRVRVTEGTRRRWSASTASSERRSFAAPWLSTSVRRKQRSTSSSRRR